MRIHGYCEECKKVKMVRVNMGRWNGKGVPTGICDQCTERKDHPSRAVRL